MQDQVRTHVTYLRLSAKLERLESLAPVFDTNESVARNWICEMSTTAIVADGWRPPLPLFDPPAVLWAAAESP